MTQLDQARIECHPKTHRGGKFYIQQILRDTERAFESQPRAMDAFIVDHLGLEDKGMHMKWFRRIRVSGSLKVDRRAKDLWIRVGRYIASNGFWPCQAILQNFEEWKILKNGGKMPLPFSSSGVAKKRRRAAEKAEKEAELRKKEQVEEDQWRDKQQQKEKEEPSGQEQASVIDDILRLPLIEPETGVKWANSNEALIDRLTEENREKSEMIKMLKRKIEGKGYQEELETIRKEVRTMNDHFLSLDNRIQHVESLEPYVNDIWHMIDTATAPVTRNGKTDKSIPDPDPNAPHRRGDESPLTRHLQS